MKKILLCTGEEKTFDNSMTMFKLNDPEYEITYAKMFSSEKIINKIKRNLGSIFIKKQLDEVWKKDLSEYDCIIIFECVVKNYAIKFIREKNPNLRIIIYFRNKFSYSKKRNLSLPFLDKLNCEYWSYNKNDCIEKGFNYNNQFWNKNFLEYINSNNELKYDLLFLGRLKNREKDLLEINNICKNKKLNNYIYLVPKSKMEFDKNVENKYMSYKEYLNKITESKVVVDLVNENNYGLTLRPLEAMFLEKKLITNYKDIIEYDFYNKRNIFILGIDDISEISQFINTPFDKNDENIINRYDFKCWITNFFKGE